jgi:hypothetical protein
LELEDCVLKLLLILDWRTAEQLVSEKIAAVTSADHYLLPVKHPFATLQAILDPQGKPFVYLSHPITEPRAGLRSGGEREREARQTINDIQTAARELRRRTVLFEPTCIDEALLDLHLEVSGRTVPLPLTSERWPLPDDERYLLYKRPTNSHRPEFGAAWERRSREALGAFERGEAIPHQDELQAAAGLLQILRSTIYRHINLRDHKLIDQSDGIVAYRPFPNGKEASGVKEELLYHDRLRRSGKTTRRAVILHPPSDEAKRPREELRRLLLAFCNDEEAISAAVERIEPGWPPDNASDLEMGMRIREVAREAGVALFPTGSKSAMKRERASDAEEADEGRGGEFRERLAWYLDALDPAGRILIEEDLSPAAFAERAAALLAVADVSPSA